MEGGKYEIELLELISCFIDAKALKAFMPVVNYTKTLTRLVLDHNE